VKRELEDKLFTHNLFVSDIKTAIRQVLFDLERNLSVVEGQCGEFSGTTLSMAVVRGSTLVVANVGDSRIVIAKHTTDCDNLIEMRRRLRTDSISTKGSFDSVASTGDTDVEALSLSISDISTRSKEDTSHLSTRSSASATLEKTSSTSLASCCDEDSASVEPNTSSRSRKRSRSNLSAEGLTIDHKPDLLHEYSRITSAGGRVFSVRYADGVVGPPRVWLGQANVPGLAMSRSIGDFVVHTAGVVSTPDISEMELDSDGDCMLIVATDGLWDQVSNSEAVNIAANHSEAHEAVAALIDTARARWLEREKNVDDITVCVIYLQGF
jgi:serine/threonine protein phosphatase PrpC